MTKLRTIKKIFNIVNSSENVGDAAALKLTLFGFKEETNLFTAAVRQLEPYNFQNLDCKELEKLPTTTLGYNYVQFLIKNNLKPLNFSKEYHYLFHQYPIGMRYIRIHDLVHVITGFDTTVVGEIGVYSFIGAQKYSKTLNRAAFAAKLFAGLLFWNLRKSMGAINQGEKMATKASPLICAPLEQMLDWDLEEVRRHLKIEAL